MRARDTIPTARTASLCQKSFKEVLIILLNGKYVSAVTEGRGENLLFLHGYLSCKESFYYQIKYFSRYFKVTAPDFLGFGKTSPIDRPFSVVDYSKWLSLFVKKCGLENAHIVAHSFGARVAFKYLSERETDSKLVITGGAGLVKPRTPQYMRQITRYRRARRFFPRFAEKHFGSKEYRTLSPIMRESYKKIVNEDLKYCAKGVKNRTLLIYGRDDTVTPPSEEGLIFNGIISGSRLIITDGGHFCFSEYPEAFNKIIYEFLTEN